MNSKLMKLFSLGMMVVFLVASLGACTPAATEAPKTKIGISMSDCQNPIDILINRAIMMVISMGVEQTNYLSQYIQLYPIIVTRNYINPCLGWNGILFFSVYVWTEDSSKVC